MGCNQTNINTPIRVFDRPSDVALACRQVTLGTRNVFDVRPIGDCAPQRMRDLTPPDAGIGVDEPYLPSGYFEGPVLSALVVQSARGELASVDVSAERVVDLQAAVPGYGFLPVGKLPEHVRVSDDGCLGMTANTDSCDVATVDLAVLYNMPFIANLDGGTPPGYADNVVRRLTPTINNVPLGASPAWIEFSHDTAPALRGWEVDESGMHGTPGACVERHFPKTSPSPGAQPSLYHAWTAFPNCQLVVELDVSATIGNPNGFTPAEVLRALRITRDGAEVVSDLSTISCTPDCSGDSVVPDGGTPPSTDLGPVGGTDVDGGSRLPMTQAQPATIALDVEGGLGRMFIGDRVSERITIVPFDVVSGALGTPRAVTLEAGALGVQVIRISPRSEAGKFLYAVARDGTVRVIDLDREVECETNPDPRALGGVPPIDPQPGARRLGCFPLGDPSTPARAPLATSPGITLPGFALARDVAFVHGDIPQASADNVAPPAAGPTTLVGDFAWIIGSDGHAVSVNIYDACPAPNLPQETSNNSNVYTKACDVNANANVSRIIAFGYADPGNDQPGYFGNPLPMELDRVSHRLRGGTSRFFQPVNFSDNVGQPRINDPTTPYQLSVAGLPKSADATSDAGVSQLPSLVQESIPQPPVIQFPYPPLPNPRYVGFADPDHVRNEAWTVYWEGLVPGTQRTLASVLPGGRLLDAGGAFCTRGVLAGDKLVFTGCLQDSDCDYLASCFHDSLAPVDVTLGMCLPRTGQQKLQMECAPLLRSLRRFRILSAKQDVPVDPSVDSSGITDQLTFAEIYEPEHAVDTHTCNTLNDASECADVVLPDATGNPGQLSTTCLQDSDGAKRCLRSCTVGATGLDGVCGLDFECEPSQMGDARCLLAPFTDGVHDLFTDCMPELKSYEVHAGDAFIVAGSSSGVFTDVEANPTSRECEIPPVSSEYVRLHQSRIPVAPQVACPASLVTGDALGPMPPDLIDPTTGVAANTCELEMSLPGASPSPSPSPSPGPLFSNPERQIHFENPFLSFVLQLPAGENVPPDNTALTFTLVGSGFPLEVTLAIDVQAQDPRYVATAPDQATVFIVDQGKQASGVGLRGQLLKLSTPAAAIDRSFQVR